MYTLQSEALTLVILYMDEVCLKIFSGKYRNPWPFLLLWTASVTVTPHVHTPHVQDTDDHPLQFTQHVYQATMSESYEIEAMIISVSAVDRDLGANAKLSYMLKESDRQYFSIATVEANNTGVLKVFKVWQSTYRYGKWWSVCFGKYLVRVQGIYVCDNIYCTDCSALPF